jgi:hypothetical protein
MYNFTKRLKRNKTPEEIVRFCTSNMLDKYFCKKRIETVRAYIRSIEGFRPRSPAKTNRFDIAALVKREFDKAPAWVIPMPMKRGSGKRGSRKQRNVRSPRRQFYY